MRRRRFGEEDEELEGEDELNLTPYLDVITTLVIFFVFTFQIVIEFRLIDVMPPELSTKTDTSNTPTEDVHVSLFVTRDGYLIDASGKRNGAEVATRAMIDKKPDGSYDTKLLHQRMIELKGATHAGESLILVAHEAVEYKDVVAAMDAVRSTDKGLLFPDVVFGEPVGDVVPGPAPTPGGTP